MSAAESEDIDVEEDSVDERPELGEDEKATFSPEAVDAIAEDVEATVDGDEEEEEDDDQPEDAQEDEEAAQAAGIDLEDIDLSAVSWGDAYVESVATLLVVLVDVHGEDSDVETDDIVQMAESGLIDISAQVDRLVGEMGASSTELSPEYAVVLGTALLAFAVLVKETDVVEELLGNLGDQPAFGGA